MSTTLTPPSALGIDKLYFVQTGLDCPNPASKDYISYSEYEHRPEPGRFNTVPSPVTRTVTITGVRIVWDRNNTSGLNDFQGPTEFDAPSNIRTLEIIADEVVISRPLRFPRTNVIIRARILRFEGDGCINTTPLPYTTRPIAKKSDQNQPLDQEGKSLGHGADGLDGERAGDIDLFVGTITDAAWHPSLLEMQKVLNQWSHANPDDSYIEAPRRQLQGQLAGEIAKLPRRFICQGSNGQKSERGGLAIREPREKESDGIQVIVTLDNLRKFIKDTFRTEEDVWRWPSKGGENYHADSMPCADLFNKGQVLFVRLVAYNDSVAVMSSTQVFFPGGQAQNNSLWGNVMMRAASKDIPSIDRFDVNEWRLRPRSGADAYASGRATKGGDGGNVTSHLLSTDIQTICLTDVLSGGEGADSPAVQGEIPPMGLGPYYWVNIVLVRWDPLVNSDRRPDYKLCDVSPKQGTGTAALKKGDTGKPGQAITKAETNASWIHPIAVEAVLRCARDMYRFEYRKQALEFIDPYMKELDSLRVRQTLHPDLERAYIEMQVLRTHTANNVDYFGNPVGWVPRLSASTNFGVWLGFRQTAIHLLYFTRRMQTDWTNLENAKRAVEETAKTLRTEMQEAWSALPQAYNSMADATNSLKNVSIACKELELEVEDVRQEATKQAAGDIAEQQAFKAACQIVGGLLKIVPVGQPIVGGVGSLVDLAAEFDWTKPNPLEGTSKLFDDLSAQTTTFLDANSDSIQAHAQSDLKKKIDDATGQIDEYDKNLKLLQESSEKLIAETNQQIEEKKTVLNNAAAANKKAIEGEIAKLQLQARVLQESLIHLTDTTEDPAVRGLNRRVRATEDELKNYDQAREKLAEELEATIAKKTLEIQSATKEKKDALQKDISGQTALKETLKGDVESLKKKKEKREEQTTKLIEQVKRTTQGLAGIGKGVVTMMSHVEPGDPRVVELRDRMLASGKFKARYQKLLNSVDLLNQQKSEVLGRFSQAQQLIGILNLQIARNVAELCALSNQRQFIGGALDCSVKQYLAGIERRAQERLIWAQYHFVKAFQYEYLKDVKPDFYNIEKLVQKLEKLATTAGADKPQLIDEEKFQEIADTVFKEQINELTKDIVDNRQHYKLAEGIKAPVELSAPKLEELLQKGHVTFNLVSDMDLYTKELPKARIKSLILKELEAEIGDSQLRRIELEFVHSGMSILRDSGGQGKYYFFQKGPDDDPISWRAIWSRSFKKDEWTEEISNPEPVVKEGGETEAVVKHALENLSTREYWPGYLSDITLWLNKGHFEALKGKITAIKTLRFEVEVVSGS